MPARRGTRPRTASPNEAGSGISREPGGLPGPTATPAEQLGVRCDGDRVYIRVADGRCHAVTLDACCSPSTLLSAAHALMREPGADRRQIVAFVDTVVANVGLTLPDVSAAIHDTESTHG